MAAEHATAKGRSTSEAVIWGESGRTAELGQERRLNNLAGARYSDEEQGGITRIMCVEASLVT